MRGSIQMRSTTSTRMEQRPSSNSGELDQIYARAFDGCRRSHRVHRNRAFTRKTDDSPDHQLRRGGSAVRPRLCGGRLAARQLIYAAADGDFKFIWLRWEQRGTCPQSLCEVVLGSNSEPISRIRKRLEGKKRNDQRSCGIY